MTQWNSEEFEALLEGMQKGEDWAFDMFFKKHYDRLVRFAKKKIGTFPLRTLDEEDVAMTAMNSLFNCLRENRLEAQSSIELWQMLISIMKRKLINLREKHFAQKRGGGKVRGDSIWEQSGEDNMFHEQPDMRSDILPGAQLELLETTDILFQQLPDDKLRQIARLLLEGYRTEDIANELNCVRRTVERKVAQIRKLWGAVLNDDR